jgi:hypothetical protein
LEAEPALLAPPVPHPECDDGDHDFSDGYAGWRGLIYGDGFGETDEPDDAFSDGDIPF